MLGWTAHRTPGRDTPHELVFETLRCIQRVRLPSMCACDEPCLTGGQMGLTLSVTECPSRGDGPAGGLSRHCARHTTVCDPAPQESNNRSVRSPPNGDEQRSIQCWGKHMAQVMINSPRPPEIKGSASAVPAVPEHMCGQVPWFGMQYRCRTQQSVHHQTCDVGWHKVNPRVTNRSLRGVTFTT